jgi:hypothetical protein
MLPNDVINSITHLGFFNRLIKGLLSFSITIAITSSREWLHSCKWHCDAMWHYGFATIVNVTTWWFLHKDQNTLKIFLVFLIIQN